MTKNTPKKIVGIFNMFRRNKKPSYFLTNDEKIAQELGFPLQIKDLWLFGLDYYMEGRKRKLWVTRKLDTYERGDTMTLFKSNKYKYPYLKYQVESYYRKNGDWGMATNKFYTVKFIGFGRVRK